MEYLQIRSFKKRAQLGKKSKKKYIKIFYFGDGKNDYCPAKLLNE